MAWPEDPEAKATQAKSKPLASASKPNIYFGCSIWLFRVLAVGVVEVFDVFSIQLG